MKLIQALKSRLQLKKKTIGLIAALVALIIIPEFAWAQYSSMSFPIIDQLMCGFISYSKTKLAPYVACLCVIIGVVGHWLGAAKVWGTMLYIAMGLGIIMGIGLVIASATGAGASCLMY